MPPTTTASQETTLDQLVVNTIRALSIDAVQKANSGHPGLPLGAAPMAEVLFQRHLKFDPADPKWFDRDRFVLSPGHGSMLLYSLLHLYGYDLSLDDIKAFRQWGAPTPGHPEYGVVPGCEATTGPLGQGTANSVGMAIAERALASQLNVDGHTVVDHRTWAIVSDGDLMEGIAYEAASIAGHLGLGKLIWLYDANDVTLDGPLNLHFSEDVARRHEALGWHVLHVEDGDTDLEGLDRAMQAAVAEKARPTLVVIKTTIGFGSPNKSGKAASHGAPLGEDEVTATKRALGWDASEPFHVPEEALAHARQAIERGAAAHAEWKTRHAAWAAARPELEARRRLAWANELPSGWDEDLPSFEVGKGVATRASGGKILNALAEKLPWILGGDADLGGSTKTQLAGESAFDGRTGAGRNLHFGVREHAMGAIANGMAYHGGLRPYTATFFVFSDYMRPAMRLAAMNHLPVVHVFTHDSIGLGEDGPTHQPVEHLASLRAMPNVLVLRPADAAETAEAWCIALSQKSRPTTLVLSRQNLPTLDRATHGAASATRHGGYVLAEADGDDPAAILIATGAEVHLALEAREALQAKGVPTRVVSMPCTQLFDEQDADYRDAVLPPDKTVRVSIEAGTTFGWERYVGSAGRSIGVDRFGASAPADVLFREYGFTVERVVAAVEACRAR